MLKYNKRILPAAVAVAFLGALAGCSSDECVENKSALPLAGFYGYAGGKVESIRVDSLEIFGVGAPGDSVLADGKSATGSLFLPFRIDSDRTSFVFRYLQTKLAAMELADTVTFVYTAMPRFVNAACGVSYVYDIKSIENTGILIDSVTCPGMQITNADCENIRIYFHTDDNDTPPPGEEGDPENSRPRQL